MPDSIERASPRVDGPAASAEAVAVRTANGWLVTFTCGEGYYSHYYTAEWDDALFAFDEPKSGYQSVAISACVDGVPGPRLAAHTIADLRRAA